MEKIKIKDAIIQTILNTLATTPESQACSEIRDKVWRLIIKGYTREEAYDFIVDISKEPDTKISGFIRELCDLSEHYSK